jgi:hypothetical protein
MSASVANGLPGGSEWLQRDAKLLGHILWTGHGTTAGRLRTALLTMHPVMSICLEPLRSTLLLSDMRQTVTWSKLSLPGCRHLIMGFVEQMLNCQFWLHGGVMRTIYCYVWLCDAYHLLLRMVVWCVPSTATYGCVMRTIYCYIWLCDAYHVLLHMVVWCVPSAAT